MSALPEEVIPARREQARRKSGLSAWLGNLYDVYFADRSAREVRHTAVGWKPDDSYTEDLGETASGEREYYKVIRKAKK
jgi:hypothetical protein